MGQENSEKKPYTSGMWGPPREDYPNVFINRWIFKVVDAVDKPITWFRGQTFIFFVFFVLIIFNFESD